MFCTKCGKENEEGAKFCNGCGATCGAPAVAETPAPTPVVVEAPANPAPIASTPAPQQPKKKTGLIIGIVVAVVAVIVAVVLAIVLAGGKDTKKDDKVDEKTTKVEETVENKDKETTTEAVAKDPLAGKWQYVETKELTAYDGFITQTYEMNMEFKDGKWIITENVYLDITKEEFVEEGKAFYESNFTTEEIDEAMAEYGYASLDEYVEDEYDSLVWEDKTEVNYSYDEKEERLYIWEDGGSKNEDTYYPISIKESGDELSIWMSYDETTTFTRVS